MRLIGHIESETPARSFGDYLYVQGVDNQIEADADGRYAVWVLAEEQLDRANAMLRDFRLNPTDIRYLLAGKEARHRREVEKEAVAQALKRTFDTSRLFPEATRPPLGPVTLGLIALCVIVFLVQAADDIGPRLEAMLRISNYRNAGLPEVRRGELWRLFTPVLMHGGMLHILFNMLWLKDLGSLIERRQGALTLGLLIVCFAGLSNVGQYISSGPNFLGMSGVVYGLFGYVWMRGHTDPASGLFIDKNTVVFMLIWFLLCFTGWVGPIANTAHAVGLGCGAGWGFLTGRFGGTR